MPIFLALVLYSLSDNGKIQLSEVPIQVFGDEGSNEDLILQYPVSAALTQEGHLYVLDNGLSLIYKLSMAGAVLQKIGNEGAGPGEFFSPTAMILAKGNLWVADPRNGRLLLFRDDVFVKTIKTTSPRSNLAVANGHVFATGAAADPLYGDISVYSPDGGRLPDWKWRAKRNMHKGSTSSMWNGIAVSSLSQNRLLIGYLFDNQITVLKPDGKVLLDRNMHGIYEAYEEKRGSLSIPAGLSAMAFGEGPDNTFLVSACTLKPRSCGKVLRLDSRLKSIIQQWDMGSSVCHIQTFPDLKMILFINRSAEIIIHGY